MIQECELNFPIDPARREGNVPIVMASSDDYLPYTSITLYSLLLHADSSHFYDILILHLQAYSDENIAILKKISEEFSNCSIRLVNLKSILPSGTYVEGHVSAETYTRLLLPKILLQYNDVLYLDGDLIVESDVAQLLETPYPENAMISGVPDLDVIGQYYGPEFSMKYYLNKKLGLEFPDRYVQAGVLIFHLDAIRKCWGSDGLLNLALDSRLRYFDQDIINFACNKSVHLLDLRWNVVNDCRGVRVKSIIANAPRALYKEYLFSRKQPWIIHYSGCQKPWNDWAIDMGEYYLRTIKTMGLEPMLLPKCEKKATLHFCKYILNSFFPEQSYRRELLKLIYFKFRYRLPCRKKGN